MLEPLERLKLAMAIYNQGDPKRLQHLLKVHSLARLLGQLEGLEGEALFLLETTALVHDIGARKAEALHGAAFRRYHEALGVQEVPSVLEPLGYTREQVERVQFIVGHYHQYGAIDSLAFQVLVEADFMVNAYEKQLPLTAVANFRDRIFRTAEGRKLLNTMFGLKEKS